MRCVCVYCGILYNVKEPFENDSETHGNCDECDRIEKHNLAIFLNKEARKPGDEKVFNSKFKIRELGNAQDKNSRPQA